MANWEKLNKEFDDLLNSMTPKKWEEWQKHRSLKRKIRRAEMQSKKFPVAR